MVTVGAAVAVPISKIRNSGVPTVKSRVMNRVASGPELVMTRSSVMTGRPFGPLLTIAHT